jgi:hypothetical protein
MIQGSTAAAPATGMRGTATSNRCPASVNALCTVAPPAWSPADVPPIVSCSLGVSAAAARSHSSDANTTTNPGSTIPFVRRGANLMRNSPLAPSRRVVRGVAPAS